MPAIPLYLIKLSCSFGLLWLFYRLVLRNLTFYTWNRWYLMAYSLLSFLIPLVNIGPIGGEDPATQPLLIKYIPAIDRPFAGAGQSQAIHPLLRITPVSWNAWDYFLLAAALGSGLLLVRFLLRWYSLNKIRRHAVLLQEGPVRIFRITQPIAPFSFGNTIYVNPDQHTPKEWEEIILHEYVHIRQRHTIDILIGEFVAISSWYNPFAWFIRHAIRQNLEFIADRAVVDNGRDKKGYQYHLLRVVGQNRYRLANNFNFSSLKKRIIMMNKIRSARLHLLRFLFVLPLLTVLLVAFRERLPLHKKAYVNAVGIVIALHDKSPLAGVLVRDRSTGLQTITDANGYYKLRIPVGKDSVDVHLDYTRSGYETTYTDRFWTAFPATTGLFDVAALYSANKRDSGMFFFAANLFDHTPADPGYDYAAHALAQLLKQNAAMNNYIQLKKTHPEIGLFYITEGKQQYLMIHRDGTAERYGYSLSPSVKDMEQKYGELPGFLDRQAPDAAYLARWTAISAQAEKDFHTSSKTVKAILFPGDSRVIAVPASGPPEVYDMMNDDPKERPAFEALYGPLPACVPAPTLHTRTDRSTDDRPATQRGPGTAARETPAMAAATPLTGATPPPSGATRLPSGATPSAVRPTDTLPRKKDTTQPAKNAWGWRGTATPDFRKALWVVDGVMKPKGWFGPDSLNQDDVIRLSFYQGAAVKQLFGVEGPDGVYYAVTKKSEARSHLPVPILVTSPPKNDSTIYIVDGNLVKYNALDSIPPDAIQSVSVPKDGVVLIKTKNPTQPMPQSQK